MHYPMKTETCNINWCFSIKLGQECNSAVLQSLHKSQTLLLQIVLENNHVKQLTFHETWILNDSSLLMIFSLYVCVDPHHFQMNLGSLFLCQKNVLCHCGLQICASWRTSLWIHVFLPVLRRSWFFQENSATKRVSMGIRR